MVFQVHRVWLWWFGLSDDAIADSQPPATAEIVFAKLVYPEEAIDTTLNQSCDAEIQGKVAVPHKT
jgi:hypothetical protein